MAGCLQSMIPNWALVVEIFIIEMLWSHNLVAKWLVLVDDVGWGNCFSWFIVWLGGVVWIKKVEEHSNGRTYVSIVFCQEE